MDEPAAMSSKHRVADLLVLFALTTFVVLYCIEAVLASTDILNLIFVLPVSLGTLVLCAVQFVANVRGQRADPVPQDMQTPPLAADEGAGPADVEPIRTILPGIGLFAAYIASVPWLGFDVGTCLFLAAFLRLHGERRWLWLIGYSVAFGFAIAFFFSRMLPYPMPLLILGPS
jgi:hypothetical protein